MKRFILSFYFGLLSVATFGLNEFISVGTPNGPKSDPQQVGYVAPCSSLTFIANYSNPTYDSYAYQILWYVNGVLVGSNNYELSWLISTSSVEVYFKISYQYSDNPNHTEEVTSPKFNLLIKSLDFSTNIAISNNSPAYGCTDPVSLSLPETPCTGSYCDLTFNVNGNYNITWQVPAGWTISSSSDKGSNVTFVPDDYTDGDITATIHFTGCNDFTETRIIHITRPKKEPEFINTSSQGCNNGAATINITPVCGAVSYTYSISGNAGVTFTSNGLQSLTTTQTSVSLSLSGGASGNLFSVKTNYGDNSSSPDRQMSFTVYSGSPTIGGSYITNGQTHFLQYPPVNNPVCVYAKDTTMMSVNNASSVMWSRISSYPGNVDFQQVGNNINFYLWAINQTVTFRITATNGCTSVSNDFAFAAIDCNSGGGGGCLQYQVSPNPANSYLNIVVPDVPAPCDAPQMQSFNTSNYDYRIMQIRVWDNMGNLKKSVEGNASKNQRISLSGLSKGVYLIEIINKQNSEKHQIIIQ